MADFVYDHFKYLMGTGAIDLDSNTFKAVLLMTNTTADTEKDKALMNAFTTLDEMDGAGYARVTLTTKTIQEDNANHRGELHCDDIAFGAVSAGTRNVQAILIYKHVTNDADSIPCFYIDSAPQLPFAANGSTVTIVINAEGLLQIT